MCENWNATFEVLVGGATCRPIGRATFKHVILRGGCYASNPNDKRGYLHEHGRIEKVASEKKISISHGKSQALRSFAKGRIEKGEIDKRAYETIFINYLPPGRMAYVSGYYRHDLGTSKWNVVPLDWQS
jgi:hypothetical protein